MMRRTLVGRKRLDFLYEAAKAIAEEKINGCYVECGVWRGGSAGRVGQSFLDAGEFRTMFLFDSFAGMPEPCKFDVDFKGRNATELVGRGLPGDLSDIDITEQYLFNELAFPKESVNIVKGWFKDTLPVTKVGDIALLHLDCDFYESVLLALQSFYDRVVKGGFVVVDDYGHWQGCRHAVDVFFRGRSFPMITTIDRTGVFWRI